MNALSGVTSKSLKQALGRLSETIPQEPSVAPQSLRPAPANDDQPDFFVPALHDIPVKDGIGLMDIAVFRLSRSQSRKAEIIRHDLPGASVEISSGAYGMATIEDYDIILMAISHLAEMVKRYRAGKASKPSRTFRPHSAEIFKFRRTSKGGMQYKALEKTLDRLNTTRVKITVTDRNAKLRESDGFGLIDGYRVISRTDTGKVGTVEITVPDWIYEGIVNHKNPDILTVNPDYFLIRKGLARFVYRMARKAAGTGEARYMFDTVHRRSGSTRALRKFAFDLREIIAANDLPDYHLSEERGKDGPVLRMRSRSTNSQIK